MTKSHSSFDAYKNIVNSFCYLTDDESARHILAESAVISGLKGDHYTNHVLDKIPIIFQVGKENGLDDYKAARFVRTIIIGDFVGFNKNKVGYITKIVFEVALFVFVFVALNKLGV